MVITKTTNVHITEEIGGRTIDFNYSKDSGETDVKRITTNFDDETIHISGTCNKEEGSEKGRVNLHINGDVSSLPSNFFQDLATTMNLVLDQANSDEEL